MLGNRHPFRVGPVREAYCESLGPIITLALFAGLWWRDSGEGEQRKEGECPILFTNLTLP